MKIEAITTGGSKGVTGIQVPTPLVQFLSFSCSFRQKSCQITDFGPNSGVGAPRLGNPGSDTDITTQILSSSPANPYTRGQKFNQQECIPVGCVPPAHSPHEWGGVCLGAGVSALRGVCPGRSGTCPGGCLPMWPVMHAGIPTPSVNRITDRCKNITCLQLRLWVVTRMKVAEFPKARVKTWCTT